MRTTDSSPYRRASWRTILVMAMAATATVVASPAHAAPTCYRVGDVQFSAFRKHIDAFVKEGKMDEAVGDAVTCDPRTAAQYITIEITRVRAEPLVGAMGVVCIPRESSTWQYTFSLGGTLGYFQSSLNWCYNWGGTHHVYYWGGICNGWTTGWGTLNGWNWDGCVQNDYIPYTLNGYYPGGIHHAAKGKFSNLTPWTPSRYFRLDIWGHYDGSCDTKYNDTLKHWC